MSNHAIPWQTIFEVEPSMKRHESLLIQAENFVAVISKLYCLSIDPPPILINLSNEFNALATETDEIHLNLGVFEKSEVFANLAVGECDASDRASLVCVKTKFIIFWIIAHELSHIGRSHYAVYHLYGSLARKPIEFDADMMALAGMYRWLRLINKNLSPMQAKGLMLDSIFWPMRAHIGSAFAEPHDADSDYPTWHLRIWMSFTKLSILDNGVCVSEVTDGAQEDGEHLFHLLLECDRAYCRYFSLPVSTFADFMNRQRNVSDFNHLSESWENIQEAVWRLQRFRFR